MSQHITMESEPENDKSPYLVLAGSYTENMLLLSKHAQYKNKGYDAEIISFENKDARHICLGRFARREQASAHSKRVGQELDIRTYVFEKGK
ncbi:MAG: hypothetical protein AB8F74_15690 [Saprospiraceae bacterium]